MNGLIVLLAATAVSVDYGWQPNPAGEIEYIIQIEPELLDALLNGDEITSRIDPRVDGVRRFRIRVGSETPPKIGTTSPGRPDPSDWQPDKVAGDDPAPIHASIPARGGTDLDPGQPAGIQPPPLVSPDRLDIDTGGAFSPAGSDNSGDDAYFPLRPPLELENTGPAPIPDPDGESRAHQGAGSPVAGQPRRLAPLPNSGPLRGQPASYAEYVSEDKISNLRSPSGTAVADEESSKPWSTLVLICLLLFGSVGLNFYLGWIVRGFYVRCRALSGQVYASQSAAT